MISKPPIDSLVEIVGSNYALCSVVAKRARQIGEQQASGQNMDFDYSDKPITAAAKELYSGILQIEK